MKYPKNVLYRRAYDKVWRLSKRTSNSAEHTPEKKNNQNNRAYNVGCANDG